MSKPAAKTREPRQKKGPAPRPPEPVNVVDGIPDRSDRPGWRRLVWILVVFAAWVTFLVYCLVAGSP